MSRRYDPSYPPRKSPLHPSALRLNDLTVGRRIAQFNLRLGVIDRFTVKARPIVGYRPRYGNLDTTTAQYEGQKKGFIVLLRSISTSYSSLDYHFLGDLGIIPYNGDDWNDVNFTVDARKEHLLPEPNPALSPRFDREDWLDDYDEEPSDFLHFGDRW